MIERRSERGKNLILTWSRYTNFQSKMKRYRETWPLKKTTTHTHKKKLIQNRHSPQSFSSHILPALCSFETTLISSSSYLPSTSSPPALPSVSSPYTQLCDCGWRLPMLQRDSHLPGAQGPPLLCHSFIHLLPHTSDLQSTAQMLTNLLSNFF